MLNGMHNKQAHKTLSSGVAYNDNQKKHTHGRFHSERPATVRRRKVYMEQFVHVGLKL
jgi:hypothetical protein